MNPGSETLTYLSYELDVPFCENFLVDCVSFVERDCAAHSCFSRSVNCGAATMKNGFQVTVLDLEALES